MPNIDNWDYKYGLTTKISASKMGPVISAKTEVTFNMAGLTKRMRIMLINQFKRGYRISSQWGQLKEMTDMLCHHFYIPEFPIIISANEGVHARFLNPSKELSQWLEMIALMYNITYKPEYYVKDTAIIYNTNNQPIINGKVITKTIIEYVNEEHVLAPIELREQVINFLETNGAFTLYNTYN